MAKNQTFQNPILDFFSRYSVKSIILVGLILFLISGAVWWRVVYSDPERTFNGMLENSLRLSGVTRNVVQTGQGQDLDQVTALSFGHERFAQSKTTLSQGGDVTAIVNTESLGTPTEDFVRYTLIDTSQKKENGEALDFSSILGVWGGGDAAEDAATNGELFNESVLGIVPFGLLESSNRAALLKTVHDTDVYEIDYGQVKRELQAGRPRYIYTVQVDAEKYVTMLKQFGTFAGLTQLESLDPGAYAGSEKLSFELTVDVWSRQLVKIVYGGGERVEELSAHNVSRRVSVPTETIPVDQLQQRLQDLQ